MELFWSCFPCFRSEDSSSVSHSYRSFSSDDDSSISPKFSQQNISLSLSNALPPMPSMVIPKNIEIGEIHHSREPECVICLGEFTEADPMIPTLCSCGENKALFHLPCLLHYKNRYKSCPVCQGQLYYQEMT